jgi:Flp pilus assembly protein TadD
MKLDKFLIALAVSALNVAALPIVAAQESKPTVRHHRVQETVSDDSSSPEVDQAEAAIQKEDFAAAESLLQKAVAAKSNDYRAWSDLGYVYNATQRVPQAIDAYAKSIMAKPDVFESNLNLGLLLARQGNNADAAKYLRAATQLKPSANPNESLARAWQALGRVEEVSDLQQAAAAYAQAAKLDPKSPDPHLAAARLFEKQKDLDEAAREYQTAAQLGPKSQEAFIGLANLYIGQKKYPDAEAALRKLLVAEPQNDAARAQLAKVLAAEGKTEDAAQQLQSGHELQTQDPQAALQLGTLYAKAGKDADAEQQFRFAAQKLPQNADAHFALGAQLMHEKRYPEAQQELLLAIRLKPDFGEAYGNLAVVAAANKQYPMALQALDDRAKYLPEIPATYFLRATTFDNLKALPQAVENYKRFLAVDDGKFPDQEWQARHRLIALDPQHADKYRVKK